MSSTRILTVGQHAAAAPLRRVVQDGGAEDLAQRASRGDRRAFTALMTAHKQPLYRFVQRRTLDAEEAYDIVQDTFVSAWGAIERFDPMRPFGTWLRSIALNKCRDRARRAKVRRALRGCCDAQSIAETLADTAPSPEEMVAARDDLVTLARAIERLPTRLKEALTLTALDGLSQAEASTLLGCSIKSIEYRVRCARELLAQQLRS